jgi:hypothetical protein
MAFDLSSILGSSVGDAFAKIVGVFKLSPEQKQQAELIQAELEASLESKVQDGFNSAVEAQAKIITAEAQSQSWLPRNVRPLLLLMWGIAITLNQIIPVIVHPWMQNLQPLQLDPWVYKLTALGFSGYVAARTFEKYTNSDN